MDQARLDKIRKLLALGEDKGATESERDLALAKAAELMVAWGIEDAMLDADTAARVAKEAIVYVQHVSSLVKTYWHEGNLLGIGIANALGAKGVFTIDGTYETINGKRRWIKQEKFGIIGFTSDIDRILVLWRSLELQATHALAQAVSYERSWEFMTAVEKFNFRRSFLVGFGRTVSDRLKALHKKVTEEATKTSTSTALVLVDRKAQVEAYVQQKLTLTSSHRRNYGNGLGAGAAAGARANIGQTGVGAGGHKAIGG